MNLRRCKILTASGFMVLALACWSIGNADCVKEEDQKRIALLQEGYHLTPGTGPITYVCDGNPGNNIVVTFYDTDPPTLLIAK